MTSSKTNSGIRRRLVIAGTCVVAAGAFVQQRRVVTVGQLTVFDLPLVSDLIEIGDPVSVISSPHGRYVRWKGRLVGSVPVCVARELGLNLRDPCDATIARFAKIGERSYLLEISLAG